MNQFSVLLTNLSPDEMRLAVSGLNEDLGDILEVLRREGGKLADQLKRQKAKNRDTEAKLTEEVDILKQKKTSIRSYLFPH
jgi:hypothetical protein